MDATFLKSATPKGRLALVSQSGALCSAISDWAAPNHLGFSAIVSLGNSLDVDFGDVLDFLATDPKTNAILLYVEGVPHARSFISAMRAASRFKPVIVLKSGRHRQSAHAAHTHTGALIGSDDVFDAALERSGAVRVNTFGQLFAAAEILEANRAAKGNRVGIITNGGGAGVLAADRAGDLGLDLPGLSEETLKTLDKLLPAFWSRSNPVDILGDAKADKFGAAVTACIADPAFDGVLVMLTPQAMTDAKDAAQAVVDAHTASKSPKPLFACWMGETSVRTGRAVLRKAGIPSFETPEQAIEAFSYLARRHQSKLLALETPGPIADAIEPDRQGAQLIIEAALSEGRALLSDVESKAVLRAYHIPVNITIEAENAAKALIAAETVGFPVAMKVLSPQITHKSDVGGVRTNIMNAVDAKSAFREISESVQKTRPEATLLGVTVEPMAHVADARELVVGVSRDPVFGPSILFGAGGTMVEMLRDSAVDLPPLNAVLADRLIRRTRVSGLLKAVRNRAAVDHQAVIDVLLRVSDLVCDIPEIQELDINPLMAGPNGVLAVDARIVVARTPASSSGRNDHLAIAPFPRQLVKTSYLADGTALTIRPIRAEDAQSEQDFVRKLSPQSRQMRFMGSVKELSQDMLVQFTQIDYSREMALIATTVGGGREIQHGVARYSINPDDTSCEFAIVVSDDLQHQGIGTRLMQALMDAAREQGIARMEGTVLARNSGMLQLMKDIGFSQKRELNDAGVYNVECWL